MPRKTPPPSFLTAAALIAALALGAAPANSAQPKIDFVRDVQPILAGRCYDCHGAEKAKGGLQLTSLAAARKGGESDGPAIVPGTSAKSSLIARITTDDENDVMPQKGERLSATEVDLLRRWIDEGAEWPENVRHWAYVKPVRPAVPALGNQSSVVSHQSATSNGSLITRSPITDSSPDSSPRNPIDAFVFARLAQEGLTPSPEADRPRWLRRVSLDLIGLPPTPEEVEAFLADASPSAHERVVDRLLASPQYGERWARPWLDLARYADSHGFQRDDLRDLWPYRDWVIRALNADMPFDQFTIWQIAGDLLPENQNPDRDKQNLDALIATGFNRCAPTNVEAGTDQEENRVNQVFDRVNTIGAVWLGTTLECAQCHNHKYDPFTQKDYYRLFAFFNHTARETDFASPKAKAALKFVGPYLELPDPEKAAKRTVLAAQLKTLDDRIAAERARALEGLAAWEKTQATALAAAGETHVLEVADFESVNGSVPKVLPDKSVLLVDEAPDRDTYIIKVNTKLAGITGFKLEALSDPSLPGKGPGRGDAKRPNFILNSFRVTSAPAIGSVGTPLRGVRGRLGETSLSPAEQPQPVPLVRASASFEQPRFEVAKALKETVENRVGWAIGQQFGRDHWAIFETAAPVGSAEGTTFTFTLVQNFGTGRTIGRVRLSALTGSIDGAKPKPADIVAILKKPAADRTPAQARKLADYFVDQDKAVDALKQQRTKITQEMTALKGPQTLVMRELEQPRETHVMNRGSFLDPGERVEAGTPEVLHQGAQASRLPSAPDAGETPALRPTRLDLARWLVDRENPLVARVTVNRWWAEFFGRGIVSTLEDFGLKGDLPTHPELLDWLAVEFMEHGWSMKHIHKLIALSATYRQSARLTPELLARDDQNKLLARGPRFRLDAETIRDNALFAAGLLSLKQGGPPVRPYQPPGLWENKVGGERLTYEVSAGEDAWRRGIYTVWKRSSPYPSFMNFDATARTACTIRRSRSNTPLQALTLLNDPVYVEAALALAKRVATELPQATAEQRLRYAFGLCVTREPAAHELAALTALLDQQRKVYQEDQKSARAVIGKYETPAGFDAAEFAAWHAITTALINLDEMITK